jgi:hypothetical protein
MYVWEGWGVRNDIEMIDYTYDIVVHPQIVEYSRVQTFSFPFLPLPFAVEVVIEQLKVLLIRSPPVQNAAFLGVRASVRRAIVCVKC